MDKVKELLYIALYACVTHEMTTIFGTVWTAVIYRKPPWNSIVPILENMSRYAIIILCKIFSSQVV